MITKDIAKALDVLKQGKLVAIPTETVYGLAGNAFNEKAITSIFALKQRPTSNPLIVHIKSIKDLEKVAENIPYKAYILAEHFWPGPLTLLLPKRPVISSLITAGKSTVAVRVPDHPMTIELLHKLDFPLVAPSGNPYGSISPTTPNHVARYFDSELEVILDGGACRIGIESTIIGFENEEVMVYRLGTLPIDEIEKLIGKVSIKNSSTTVPEAPGMDKRHYAPNKQSYLTDNVTNFITANNLKNVGVISYTSEIHSPDIAQQIILSRKADLKEASRNLYNAMHELDLSTVDCIVFETFPNEGLGLTMNDKLQRATTPKK
jgi:L-threonylcarbamoyladenylate synthase